MRWHSSVLLLAVVSVVATCTLSSSLARATPPRCLTPQLTTKTTSVRSHRVEKGDSLSVIALRYGASVDAMALANGLGQDRKIRIGQSLVIPREIRPGGGDDWMSYTRAPKRRGYLDLIGHKDSFRGQVVEDGKLLPAARKAISEMLGAKGSRPPVPDRLIRLLVRVSDTFGGRQLYIVSGYRTTSFYADSHHKRSEAVDFSVVGVPNVVLRQFLLLLDDVGVGYYPRSSFVHLDVRPCPTQWVDYSGPYEPPQRTPGRMPDRGPGRAPVRSKVANASRLTELDAAAAEVTAALEKAAPSRPDTPAKIAASASSSTSDEP
jgi:uncharacterized protein YcbK (DUF882 family)